MCPSLMVRRSSFPETRARYICEAVQKPLRSLETVCSLDLDEKEEIPAN